MANIAFMRRVIAQRIASGRKRCTSCLCLQEFKYFYANARSADRHQSICKKCDHKFSVARRKRKKELVRRAEATSWGYLNE
jgi:hypothetical protein